MRSRRVFLLSLNALVVLAVLTTTLLGPLPLSVASAHPRSAAPFATTAALSGAYGLSAQAFARAALLDATTPPCNAFPIALNIATLAGAQVGATLGDIYNGATSGNFGWLSWTGDPSEPTLVTSLTLPGNSATYVNPNDPNDHTLAVGDWVSGKPGVSNSKAVRDALTALEGIDLTVPVWDQAQGNGNTGQYHIVGFVQVQLTAFQLPGANRITAIYLGNTPCGGGPLPPPAGPSLSGATLTLSPGVAGPNITGTTQTLKATLKSRAGVPLPDVAVQFTISGPNATMTNGGTTNSAGEATYTYEGDASGTDSIRPRPPAMGPP